MPWDTTTVIEINNCNNVESPECKQAMLKQRPLGLGCIERRARVDYISFFQACECTGYTTTAIIAWNYKKYDHTIAQLNLLLTYLLEFSKSVSSLKWPLNKVVQRIRTIGAFDLLLFDRHTQLGLILVAKETFDHSDIRRRDDLEIESDLLKAPALVLLHMWWWVSGVPTNFYN